jgi:hypothetical protein
VLFSVQCILSLKGNRQPPEFQDNLDKNTAHRAHRMAFPDNLNRIKQTILKIYNKMQCSLLIDSWQNQGNADGIKLRLF